MTEPANDVDFRALSIVDLFEDDDNSETEAFHEQSKFTRVGGRDVVSRINLIVNHPAMSRMMRGAWKAYPGHGRMDLPEPQRSSLTFDQAVAARRSSSNVAAGFTGAPIRAEQLSAILANTYGVTAWADSTQIPGLSMPLRATCSAGALYPLEVYPVVFNVDGVSPGLYHYAVETHQLECLSEGDLKSSLLDATTYREALENASVLICVTAMLERSLMKYRNRGYRFLMNEVGAVLQSLYLSSAAVSVGGCAIGGFYDDEVGDVIGADNVNEVVTICFALGHLPAANSASAQ